jgi:endo-1,3(4)-beta-glucanase
LYLWVLISISVTGRPLYHHSNHPIKWVRLTGVIVAVDDFYGRKVYTLDDSSGKCIECTCPAPAPPKPTTLSSAAVPAVTITEPALKEPEGPTVTNPKVPWDEVDVGVVVKIKGGIREFRDERQVEIIKVEVLRSTDQEVRCWNEVLAFRRDILSVPWVVSREQEEKYKRRAMREKRHEKKGKVEDGKYKKGAGRDDGREKRSAESRDFDKQRHSAETRAENSGTRHKRGADDRNGESERRQKARTEDQDRKPEKRQEKPIEDIDAVLRRERKDRERRERHEHKAKSRRDGDGLGPANKANYPSLAARRMAAGK